MDFTNKAAKDQMDTEKILNSMNIHEQNGLLKSCLRTICDGLFHLYYQWRTTIDSKNVSESDAIAQCILQMVICKIHTLLVMCEGINVRPEKDTIRILDIPSMLSVLRSLYEMAFVFHNIYAEQETEEDNKSPNTSGCHITAGKLSDGKYRYFIILFTLVYI